MYWETTNEKRKILDYLFTIRHLSKEDGGGYLIEYPDLPGSCAMFGRPF